MSALLLAATLAAQPCPIGKAPTHHVHHTIACAIDEFPLPVLTEPQLVFVDIPVPTLIEPPPCAAWVPPTAWPQPYGGNPMRAPEIDPTNAGTSLTVLLGALIVLAGRKP